MNTAGVHPSANSVRGVRNLQANEQFETLMKHYAKSGSGNRQRTADTPSIVNAPMAQLLVQEALTDTVGVRAPVQFLLLFLFCSLYLYIPRFVAAFAAGLRRHVPLAVTPCIPAVVDFMIAE